MERGQAAVQQKNFAAAAECFGKALAESPKDPQIAACLGQSLCWLGDRDAGLKYLRLSGQWLLKKAKKSRDTGLALDLADQLQHWSDYDGALELCKQAVQIAPNHVRGFQLLALSHSRLNQKKPALAAAKQALKLVPDNPMLTILVATLEISDGQYQSARERLAKALSHPLMKPEEKFRAHKEMARLLDRLGEFSQVFAHLRPAADIAPQLVEVKRQDATLVPTMLADYKTAYTRDLLGRWAGREFPADLPPPVFVLGFMRTGTTLTQEVLGTHPDLFVADETDLIAATVKELRRVNPQSTRQTELLAGLDWDGVLHLRRFYWDRARALFGDRIGTKHLLDKTTMNSIDLGFINAIFPDAKLVFLLRDPRDVCLSCFMQTMVPTPSTVPLLTWLGTARFYGQVMDWWLTVKPMLTMDFVELRYEDAVFDFEAAFRRVFSLIGLDWNPAVAEFHQRAAGKYIASPSYEQVAQPLYSSSVGRWRHYADEFAEIEAELKPFLAALGYD